MVILFAMNPFGTGGIDLVLSSQARSRSAGQEEYSPVKRSTFKLNRDAALTEWRCLVTS